jgi:hypothetical protein
LGPRLVFPAILVVNWVSSCLSFFLERLHCCYIYFSCSYVHTLDPCASNVEFIVDLIKCLYSVDTNQRGHKGWKQTGGQGEDRVTLWITLIFLKLFFNICWFFSQKMKYCDKIFIFYFYFSHSGEISQRENTLLLLCHKFHCFFKFNSIM